jgi:hypothetical protein
MFIASLLRIGPSWFRFASWFIVRSQYIVTRDGLCLFLYDIAHHSLSWHQDVVKQNVEVTFDTSGRQDGDRRLKFVGLRISTAKKKKETKQNKTKITIVECKDRYT